MSGQMGPVVCMAACACCLLVAWLVYLIWSIVAVCNAAPDYRATDPACPGHAQVFWLMSIMLISSAVPGSQRGGGASCGQVQLCVAPCLQPNDPRAIQQNPQLMCHACSGCGSGGGRVDHLQSPRGIAGLVLGVAAVGVMLYITIQGIATIQGTSYECEKSIRNDHSDLWVLFLITVVLSGIGSVILGCVLLCLAIGLATGALHPPDSGYDGAYGPTFTSSPAYAQPPSLQAALLPDDAKVDKTVDANPTAEPEPSVADGHSTVG